MSIINFMGQILLGIPFIVFAFWYEQEEALFHTPQTYPHTIYRHAAFGLFFSISFAILGMMFFPPITRPCGNVRVWRTRYARPRLRGDHPQEPGL
jgi:hypothetical protein